MKIGVGVINSNEKLRGVDRYAIELISHLSLIDKLNTYYIFYAPWQSYITELISIDNPNFHLVKVYPPNVRSMRTVWQLRFFQQNVKKYSLDILHYTNKVPFLGKKCPVVTTVHDMSEFVLPTKYRRLTSLSKQYIAKLSISKSDRIIAVSAYAKKSVIDILHVNSGKIKVIPEGVSIERFYAGNCDNIQAKYKLDQNYVLFVGVVNRGKNIELIINAFSKLDGRLKDSHKLVIVGRRGNAYIDLMKLVNELQLSDKVSFLGHVPDEHLQSIYRQARLFLFPSRIEGFGLPALEAMACNVPVIASNSTSLPEVCGDAAVLVDPSDIEGWTNALESMLSDNELRQKLIRKGIKRVKLMSWHITAKETLKEYDNLIRND